MINKIMKKINKPDEDHFENRDHLSNFKLLIFT